MTVAIVHYHLGPGGVSRVIARTSRLLAAAGLRHVILAGETPDESADSLPVRVVEGLAYGGNLKLETLRRAAAEALGCEPDVWHFHNHSLGKNATLADAVARLAEDGARLVLHIHDLAEEGRPANYRNIRNRAALYPVSERIIYAFLNPRDLGLFRGIGLPEANAVLLPNPVPAETPGRAGGGSPPLLFAPARGIRRKNLGELVFLSALAPEGTRVAVSRAPRDPAALAIHDAWRRFAGRLGLAVEFDVTDRIPPEPGLAASFESWTARATHIVTTSVAEGFGLPFLEAIALGKPLLGRDLPHVTAEHARHGIVTGNLYGQLRVPADWIDVAILRDYLKTTLERNHRLLDRHLTRQTLQRTLDHLLDDGWLDFGNLPEPLQQGVIERLGDPASRNLPVAVTGGRPRKAREWLAEAVANRVPSAKPEQLAPWSPAAYQQSLSALYQEIAARPASPVRFLPARELLHAFLVPERFHFLLSAPEAPPPRPFPFRAVIFDIYGTLLIAPAGGVKADPEADPVLKHILEGFGHTPPESPSGALHQAVLRHHAEAGAPYPEVDLRRLWREILGLEPGGEITSLVIALEDAWHPALPMPGAAAVVRDLSRQGVSLGLLSNAQCNTLHSLGDIADLFAPELTLLSYQHGVAKPSPALFETLACRLEGRGILPGETLFVGNDPLQDIAPAAAAGFRTALFTGHPDSLRPGGCVPDFVFADWRDLPAIPPPNMRGE